MVTWLSLLQMAAATCPDAFDYVIIADDTGDLALENPDSLTEVSLPSINVDGDVGFRSWTDGGSALHWGDGNQLVEVYLDAEVTGSTSELRLVGQPAMNADHAFAVRAFVPATNDALVMGVVTVGAGGASVVVDADRLDPDNPSPYSGFGSDVDITESGAPIVSATALNGVDSFILAGDNPVVTSNAEARGLRSPISNGTTAVAYLATSSDTSQGLFQGTPPSEVAAGDPDTGLGPSGRPALNRGGAVAWVHVYEDPNDPARGAQRIERAFGGGRTVLADSADGAFIQTSATTVSMGRSMLDVVDPLPYATDCVVFNGVDPVVGGDALFIVDEDGLATVVTELDEVDGAVATSVEISALAANSLGQVAFFARLSDGRNAIVRADPVDLPTDDGPIDDTDTPDPDEPAGPSTPADPPPADTPDEAGCGCHTGPRSGWLMGLLPVLVGALRRPRAARPRSR